MQNRNKVSSPLCGANTQKSKKRLSYSPPKNPATHRIGSLLSAIARARDFDAKMLEQRAFALWRKVVGPPFSTNMHPVSLSGGTLKLYTEHPTYRTELLFHKEKFIANLNAELGDAVLTDLRIEIRQVVAVGNNPALRGKYHPQGDIEKPNRTTQGAHKARGGGNQLTPEALDAIEQTLSEITDAELKTSLRQLFMTQMAHGTRQADN